MTDLELEYAYKVGDAEKVKLGCLERNCHGCALEYKCLDDCNKIAEYIFTGRRDRSVY